LTETVSSDVGQPSPSVLLGVEVAVFVAVGEKVGVGVSVSVSVNKGVGDAGRGEALGVVSIVEKESVETGEESTDPGIDAQAERHRRNNTEPVNENVGFMDNSPTTSPR
jgi:hypothetical protein